MTQLTRHLTDPAGKIYVLIAFTLCAFAANSLLCRMALGGGLIDSF